MTDETTPTPKPQQTKKPATPRAKTASPAKTDEAKPTANKTTTPKATPAKETTPETKPAAAAAAEGTPVTPDKDHGYFGPGSVTWKIFADPKVKLAGYAALTLQALNPEMMKLFFKATTSYSSDGSVYNAERDDRTGRYFQTVAFGDKEHVDKASAMVRRLHANATYTDPRTGIVSRADNPLSLAWTHNTFVWSIIRVMEEFGPQLSIQEVETFIKEQHISAKLIGIDENAKDLLPSTYAELDTWVNDQKDWLGVGIEASESMRGMRKQKFTLNPKEKLLQQISLSIFAIIPEWAANMYGIEVDRKVKTAVLITREAFKATQDDSKRPDLLKKALADVQTHPYQKTESDRKK